MTKRNVFDCDKCGTKSNADFHITVEFGWQTDPAGGFGGPRQESFDLCPVCRNRVNKKLMDILNDHQRKDLLRFIVEGTKRDKAWSTSKQCDVKLWEL